ncbi:MAG: bacteriohemerythrin [Betaproteobacteria bacterium]|nr:MAG: bacteriohemerythrin [Betaproteobacteria bacterium]
MPIHWKPELDTGIDVIDQQHRRIVDYINVLETANDADDRTAIGRTLGELVEYTMSHFAFEESLQEEAGYAFCKAHKRVHELFVRRVNEYVERHRLGDDIGHELHALLVTWLLNHIKRDDADYVGAVKANMIGIIADKREKQDTGWFRRFFRRAA